MGQVWSRFWTSAPRWFLKESTSPLDRFYVFNFSVKEVRTPLMWCCLAVVFP